MKKLLIISIIVLASPFWGDGRGNAQSTVFIPDTNFRNFLNTNYPAFMDGSGDSLIIDSAATLTGTLNCSSQNIANLTGVEYFVNITQLWCFNNQLTSLPALTNNTALQELWCTSNQLTALPNLNTALQVLWCNNNKLTTLPALTNNTALLRLECSGNQLTILPDLTINSALEILNCYANQLTALPTLTNNIALRLLNCSNNQLTALPALTNNIALQELSCSYNPLTALPALTNNTALKWLYCYNNQLTALPDLTNNTTLWWLYCYNNLLTALPDFTNNTALQYLYCYNNLLTTLPDLTNNTALLRLLCDNNQLTALPDLTNNTAFKSLYCYNNKLDFSDARELRIADAISTVTTYFYSPQNPFGIPVTFNLNTGDALILSIANQDSALSYQWFRGTDTIFGATDTVLVILNITSAESGVYTCRSYGTALLSPPMIFAPGISEFVSEPIQVNVSTVGVEESNVLSSIVIYPNPSNGQFIVEINSENPDKAELRIFDLLGKEVHYQSILYLNNTYQLQINLNSYQKGIYFLTLNTSEGRQFQKLIVQ